MKRIIALIIMMASGLAVQAQQVNTVKHRHSDHQLAESKVIFGFGCPLCSWNSPQPGKCIHHNIELVPDGWYYCKTDVDVMSAEPAKCHRCGILMTRMQTGVLRPGTAIKDTIPGKIAVTTVTMQDAQEKDIRRKQPKPAGKK
jgi:hypothetical protein